MKIIASQPKPISSTQPKFSGMATPGGFLDKLDFVAPGIPRLNLNKVIYASVIGSRLAESRSGNELSEVMVRDPLGWFFWFYGNPLMQTFLTTTLVNNTIKPMLIRSTPKPEKGLAQLNWMLDPTSRFTFTSDTQLKQRLEQVTKAMVEANENTHSIESAKNLLKRAIQTRALVSFIGLAFAIGTIGVGTTWINFWLTRSRVKKELHKRQHPELQQHANKTTQLPAARAMGEKLDMNVFDSNWHHSPANQGKTHLLAPTYSAYGRPFEQRYQRAQNRFFSPPGT